MVRTFLSAFTHEVRGLHEAAYLLAAFALSSQVLALIRDRLLAGTFGASQTLDVYYAAFRIPDFLFATVASLLSLYALLPILSRLEEENTYLAIAFLRRSLVVFFGLMALVAGAIVLFAPILIPLVAPGIPPAARGDLVLLTQVLLLQPILLGASNIVAALTQLRHRFLLYAISPLLYNLGIIAGIAFLYPLWGIMGLGFGVVLGALMHFLIQAFFFFQEDGGHGELPRERFWQGLYEVLKLSIPRTLSLASSQISLLILVALASYFASGSIAIFNFAFNLQAVPLTIIGVSYSVAAFPTLSRLFAAGNGKDFLWHIEVALRHILFWTLPATVLVIVLRAQLVRTILGSGAFDWSATRLTAAALALFILSLTAQSITLLIARAYYAAGKTEVPLKLGALSVGVSVGSAVFFVALFHFDPLVQYFVESLLRVADTSGTTVLMLAFGYSVGAIVQAGMGLYCAARDFGLSLAPLRELTFQSFGAAIIGGGAAYGALWMAGEIFNINTLIGIVSQGLLGGIVGLMVTGGVLALLGNAEFLETLGALRRRFAEVPPVVLEPSDVS
jgi:putative peptidoglycan lipid II flippase